MRKFASAVALALLALACDAPEIPLETPSLVGSPVQGGTVVVGLLSDIQGWNPYFAEDSATDAEREYRLQGCGSADQSHQDQGQRLEAAKASDHRADSERRSNPLSEPLWGPGNEFRGNLEPRYDEPIHDLGQRGQRWAGQNTHDEPKCQDSEHDPALRGEVAHRERDDADRDQSGRGLIHRIWIPEHVSEHAAYNQTTRLSIPSRRRCAGPSIPWAVNAK